MKMKVETGCAGCSFGGEFFPADDQGTVDVPAEAVPDLLVHGLTFPDALTGVQAADDQGTVDVPAAPAKPAKRGSKK